MIVGATSAMYTPTAADDGGRILRVTVGYDDGVGTGRVAVSASTLAVDRPGVVSLSTVKPVAGEAVTATLTDADGGLLNEEWQWESSPDEATLNWTDIGGAEASSYTPSASLAGKLLRAVVEYDDATGNGRKAVSRATAALDRRGAVTLSSSTPVVSQELTATLTDADGSSANKVWKWERSPDQAVPAWSAIVGASSLTYTPLAGDAGKLLRAKVTYDDGVGTGRIAVSGATEAVDQRGAVTL